MEPHYSEAEEDELIVFTGNVPANIPNEDCIPNAYREAAIHYLFVIDRVMEWMRDAKSHSVAWWQVQFALGTSHCLGRTMTKVASELGVLKATISKGSTEICRQCNLPPSPYMKKAESQFSYQKSRKKQIAA